MYFVDHLLYCYRHHHHKHYHHHHHHNHHHHHYHHHRRRRRHGISWSLVFTTGTFGPWGIIHGSLQWRHNDHDGVSNHQPHCCLLNRLFRRRSKRTPKLRVTGLCVGNPPGPGNSPHIGPVTREMFPFDDVIMFKSQMKIFRSLVCTGTVILPSDYNKGRPIKDPKDHRRL